MKYQAIIKTVSALKTKTGFFRRMILVLFIDASFHTAFASDIYVSNIQGSDNNTGQTKKNAFRTIQKAVGKVKPGDVLHLLNTGVPYKESLILIKTSGTPEARITIDGHGSTISGSESLDLTEWEQVGSGLYKNSTIVKARNFGRAVIYRYFFLFDGKINRMGRSLKGSNLPYKKPTELQPDEWTFDTTENAFYLKIDPRKRLADCNITHPVRPTGVQIAGSASYITVKNIISTNVYNDGFGITNEPRQIRFENIQSLYCGDDGISAHAASEYEVDGFISIGNGTGICDTGNSTTSYNRVFIKDCVGVDLYFLNEKPKGPARYVIRNSVIITNGARPVVFLTAQPEGTLNVEMDNVLIVGSTNGDATMRVTGNTTLNVKNCTFTRLNFLFKTNQVTIKNSILSGIDNSLVSYPGTTWGGINNIYSLDHFLLNDVKYSTKSQNISDYKTQTIDYNSVWATGLSPISPVKREGIKTGADVNTMCWGSANVKSYFQEAMSWQEK